MPLTAQRSCSACRQGPLSIKIRPVKATGKSAAAGEQISRSHAACSSSRLIRSLARRAYSSVTSMPVAE